MRLVRKYATTQIGLHWAAATMLLALFLIGYYMTSLPRGQLGKSDWVNLHKSLGLTAVILIVWRVFERARRPAPPQDPAMQAWEAVLARVTHRLIYVCMIGMPVSGYLGSSFNKYGTRFWGIALPRWGWVDERLKSIFFSLHDVTSYFLLGLIILHVGAVIKHQWLDRMRCLQRMLPGQ